MSTLFQVVLLEHRVSLRRLRAIRRALKRQGAAGVVTWTDERRTLAAFSANWQNAEHEARLIASESTKRQTPT
jgi:hypothetical protein